jgi:K+-sensing histidine kinase KdpD
VHIHVNPQEDKPGLMVEDNGPNIPDQLKSRIFHRYQREERDLDSFIVRTLMDRYSGTMSVHDPVEGQVGIQCGHYLPHA